MLATCLLLAAASLAGPSPLGAAAAGTPRRITMDEAVLQVTDAHPDIEASRHDVRAARAAAHAQRGRLLPQLRALDAQSWSYSKTRIGRSFYPGLEPTSLARLPSDVTGNILAISASQPLLGLLHIGADYRGKRLALLAQEASHRGQVATLRTLVRTQFVRLFEARALAQTAIASQQSLEEQVEDARQEVAAGVLTQTDVLRLEVAAAEAKQQVIASLADAASLHADLMEMLNLADGDLAVEFVEPEILPVRPASLPAVPALRLHALAHRPELLAGGLHAAAAKARARAQGLMLLPEINAQASYGHIWGEPLGIKEAHGGLQANVFAVLLSASWPLWEWGSSYYAYAEAHHEARAAKARAESARRQVGSEVAAKHAALVADASAIDVAQAQVESSEEAFRVMQAARGAGSATTTDLLQAEAARTQARMNLVRARYETVVAQVALQRAMGDDT